MLLNILLVVFALYPEAAHDGNLAETAKNGDAAAVRKLIEQKADANVPVPMEPHPLLGDSVRRFADRSTADTRRRRREKAESIRCDSDSDRHHERQRGHDRVLLDSGADPNTVDPANQSALMNAVRSGELEAVRVLLDLARESIGWSPLTVRRL